MKNIPGAAILIALAVVGFIAYNTLFVVEQTEQALVMRFGQVVEDRGLVTKPGLYFKVPFIEDVVFLDNRNLDVETPKTEVIAADNQRIEVDAFVRYRITNPLLFYQTLRTVQNGASQLQSLLNSSMRRVLGEASLTQIVRDERAALMVKIRDQVNAEGARYGVEVIDVRIRRADLPKEISEKVFSRMQSERARMASGNRAEGARQAQIVRAKADREVVVLRAEAQREADQTRGQGEAERNRIFAEAFGADPDFFAFYRSMQAYEAGLKSGDTRMVVSPKSEFFRFFGDPHGRPVESAKPDAEKTN
jgi:membrane protease subunit HflC